MKSVTIVSLLAAVALSTALSPAQSAPAPGSRPRTPRVDPAIAAHAEGVKTLVENLKGLAEWCEKQKLDKERAKVFELILVFEPDNNEARKAIGYVTAKGGGWERSKGWTAPENRDTEPLKDFRAKKAEVGGAFLDAMTKVLEEERRDIGQAIKARIIGDMTAIDHLDPRTKAAGGEAALGGKWVLAETAAAPGRRKQLQGFAAAAIKAAGTPQPAEAAGDEASWDIKWSTIVETENFRVLGTGEKDEVIKTAILCQAAGELFAKTFEVDSPVQTMYHTPIYLIGDATAKANFLLRNKHIKPEEREKVAKVGGHWIGGAKVQWGPHAEQRIDGAVRGIIGQMMNRSFGITADHGALYEGIGIHLSWFLTGTRLTWTIGKRKYAQSGSDGLADRLTKAGADWFAAGYELVGGKSHPNLKPLFAKMVNDLETEDMLGGFMFGVWLLEGRKDDAPRFLRRAGRNLLEEGAMEAFGLEINQLEDRWVRWAKESRGAK